MNVMKISLTLLLFLSSVSQAEVLADTVERVTESVVGVGAAYPARAPTGGKSTRRLLGSGFAVSMRGKHYIITNAHVLPDDLDVGRGERLAVFSGRGAEARQIFAELTNRDDTHDLAALTYEGAILPSLVMNDGLPIRAGDRVAFTGFPIGAVLGLYPATHEGIVAAVTPIARVADRSRHLTALQLKRMRERFEVYQLDAIAYPGNSGSAVYLQDSGQVIGVMNSVFVKDTREQILSKPSGIAYVIPVEHVRQLLDDL